ncbi:nucleotidyltransferase domain-containing protein [Paenibacillus faecalis]|uniref:nucleotidyltransferase domain-containing protein n=1 Tax=Paenibacillus faecalis TaxID=2079532 RepID=UPI000D0E3E5F|nr:nucleotidyltransferase domain-containing protein [Paenibacillus faecalis]
MNVTEEMKLYIQQELERIERDEQVVILYACESGSRAWGFPSEDSDYDVRFIYVRPVEWYLSIFDKRDVIERPISDALDISGWDLKKALGLFRKSNPSLLEWLESPIRYLERHSIAGQIRSISPLAFSPKSCMYHYLSMAKGNYRKYLQGEFVKIKKYFYVLRPLLACQWIEQYNEMPPMEFEKLVNRLLEADSELKRTIDTLLIRKKSGQEIDFEPRLPVLNDFIEEQISVYEGRVREIQTQETQLDDRLDHLFRTALAEAWGRERPWICKH